MKKFLPYILILAVILQIFAPFTIGSGVNNNLEIQINKADAEDLPFTEEGYKNAFPNSELTVHTRYIEALGDEEPTVTGSIDVLIDTGVPEGTSSSSHWKHTDAQGETHLWGLFDTGAYLFHPDDFVLVVKEISSSQAGLQNITNDMLKGIDSNGVSYDLTGERMSDTMKNAIRSNILITTNSLQPITELNKLKPGEKYNASLYYRVWSGAEETGVGLGETIPTISGPFGRDYIKIATLDFDAASKINPIIEGDTTLQNSGQAQLTDGGIELPTCSILPEFRIGGCIAQGIYYLFFKTTSFVFALAGKILDFTLMYSIQDSSYRSPFVVEGWGLIRDFCNMFFIFILLYIAFGTILNLNSVKTKEMIINVVIIGLLINFSLFATQVIIDASNILTRVFYNQKTIVTGSEKDANDNPVSELGDFGEIKLSEAIVTKVNPVKLITQASKVDSIPVRGSSSGEETDNNITPSTFIIVVLLATAVNVVGIMAFLSSALIFIGRVVMLWLAMIFAPLAFFSYLVPKLRGVKMVGWENWWPDTFKMAFVAPVFVFFMYLIVGFMNTGLSIINTSMKDVSTLTGSLSFVIAIVVPFIFMMILLMKAKSIAVDMSGEMGAAMAKAGSAVGGAVVGAGVMAATGGAAMAMRGTLGRAGNAIANSKWLANAEAKGSFGGFGGWMAKQTRNAGTGISKSSFDVRATKLGASAAKSMGVEGSIGKAKEGGFAKYKSEQIDNRKKRAQELKNIGSSDEKNKILEAEAKINEEKQKIENSPEKQKVNIKNEKLNAIKADPKIERDVETAEGELKKIERELQDLKDKGQSNTRAADMKRAERDYKINQISNIKKPIKDAEKELKDAEYELYNISTELRDAEKELMKHKNDLANTQNRVLKNYAQSIQSAWGNRINTILSFGQETKAANEQAAREILANLPQEK